MGKNRKGFLYWLFDEDVESVDYNGQESVELGPVHLVLTIIIPAVFLLQVFYGQISDFFNRPDPQACEYIEKHIENNYFEGNRTLENPDFSNGQNHWVTSDGGELFPDSDSCAYSETEDFHSAPAALKIKCNVPASRYYYSKKRNHKIVDNPYSYKESSCWLGVLPGAELSASLWYKGDILTFYVQYMTKNGVWSTLEGTWGDATGEWKKLQINKRLPDQARAIMLEITLNRAAGEDLPVVIIDDVELRIENQDGN